MMAGKKYWKISLVITITTCDIFQKKLLAIIYYRMINTADDQTLILSKITLKMVGKEVNKSTKATQTRQTKAKKFFFSLMSSVRVRTWFIGFDEGWFERALHAFILKISDSKKNPVSELLCAVLCELFYRECCLDRWIKYTLFVKSQHS